MICISLGSISFEECLKALSKSEFTEIRIDLLDYSKEQFKTLFSQKRKTIATCRSGKLSDSERMDLLKEAILDGAGYVDIEYEANENYRRELSDFASKYQAKVIISYHDYCATPDRSQLEDIINTSFGWGADYTKLATMAVTDADNARILGLYENHKNLIAFCMGEKGVITRISAPILGSLFTFAALNRESATAPGQIAEDELVGLYNAMGFKF
jgi:3-dehydroquinate dehydratase-1